MTEQHQTQTRIRAAKPLPDDSLTRRARVLASVERTPRDTVAKTEALEKGKWNQALYLEYKAAPEGPRKRRLLNQLLIVNEPLVRLMVDQMCGRGDSSRRKGRFQAMGGLQGARELEWDDAFVAGQLAMQKALEQFDPSKRLDKHGKPNPYKPGEDFKISLYFRNKLRHELQRLIWYGESLVRIPRGSGAEAIPVALVGEEQTIDLMSGGSEDLATVAAEHGITPEMIAEWERTGEWPESIEELRASLREEPEDKPIRPVPPPPAAITGDTPLDLLLRNHLVWNKEAKTPLVAIAWRYEVIAWPRPALPHSVLRKELLARNGTAVRMRVPWCSSVPAIRGWALRRVSQKNERD